MSEHHDKDLEDEIPITEILSYETPTVKKENDSFEILHIRVPNAFTDTEEYNENAQYIICEAVGAENDSLESAQADNVQFGESSNDDSQPAADGELYNCSACGMYFNNIIDHIKQYHEDQEVVVEVDDGSSFETIKLEPNETEDNMDYQEEYIDTDFILNETNLTEDAESTNFQRSGRKQMPQLLDTITEEPCLDKDGRLFTRKVVKIEQFWNDSKYDFSKKSQKGSSAVPIVVEQNKKIKNEYECNFCDSSYPTIKSLTAHMRVHKSQMPKAATVETEVIVHTCNTCDTKFPTNKSLRLHMRMHDPVKRKTLEDAMTSDLNGIMDDEGKGIGAKDREMFYCKICDKNYDEVFNTIHMQMHSGEPKFNCEICNKKFESQANLTMHLNAHQEQKTYSKKPNSTGLPYACFYCGREFSRPHEKVKHERIHTGEKPHVCEICGKSFRVSYCLTLHMRTHTMVRPYVCSHCNKRFKAHSVYNHHLLTHSDVRAYKCPFCPKAFKTAVQLAGHKNSHTKPFSCTECNRPFATLYAVRSHLETHKKLNHNLRHKCAICGASYARSFALQDHIKEIHGTSEHVEIVDNDNDNDNENDNEDIAINLLEQDVDASNVLVEVDDVTIVSEMDSFEITEVEPVWEK